MRSPQWTLALAAVLTAAGLASAADLTKVERRLAREPAYKDKPRYCLLVFGPEVKSRLWVVQDGDRLFVDRNGNGDLTDDGEPVPLKNGSAEFGSFEVGDVTLDGLTHKGLSVGYMKATEDYVENAAEWQRIKEQSAGERIWNVRVQAERPANDKRPLPRHIGYVANGDGLGFLVFSTKPEGAPIVPFNGPWTLGLQDIKQRLTVGHPATLQIGVGTQGIGPGTFSFVLYPNTIPNDAYPVADVTFPPKSPGGEPVRQTFTLKDRC